MRNTPASSAPAHAALAVMLAGAALSTACVHVKTEPIKIEPIYIEITINHRVQKELDAIFADIDRASSTATYIPIDTP